MAFPPARALAALACLLLFGCDNGGGPMLSPIPPQTLSVNVSHEVTIGINNPGGAAVAVVVEAPELPSFDRVTSLTTSPAGAVFRWAPLSSQTGTHELTFVLTDGGGGEYDRQTVLFEVQASTESGPQFVRPGPGGTFDLERDPCVTVEIEVRDADSEIVEIGARSDLPDRATLSNQGDKRALFDWCPTEDQQNASEKWTIEMFADDGEHRVDHDFIIILRTPPKDGCPGEDPVVTIDGPLEGERVVSGTTYNVEVMVTDDNPIRALPILHYTTSEPADRSDPDVATEFEPIEFVADEVANRYVARIPNLGLEVGETQQVFFLVSATDNDDESGIACDHRVDTDVVAFFAEGGEAPDGTVALCELCGGSTECESGLCAQTATGGRCIESCSGDGMCVNGGSCGGTVTIESGTVAGCGPTTTVCGATEDCTEDSREENDNIAQASAFSSTITDGQICEGDDDFFSFSVPSGNRITVTIDDYIHDDGDLDLSLLAADGTILDPSGSVFDMEEVEYCNAGDAGTFYARVFGFDGANQNNYRLDATIEPDALGCCTEDSNEGSGGNDSRADATTLTYSSGTATFSGQVCAQNQDWYAIPITGPSVITATLTFTHADGDLDIDIISPTGADLTGSMGGTTDDNEMVMVEVAQAGTYALRIIGFQGAVNDYTGMISVSASSGCSGTEECPEGTVCGSSGECEDDGCQSDLDCPGGHTCPPGGPIPASGVCGTTCSFNFDCRGHEECKWTSAGRACLERGSGNPGDACTTNAGCGQQMACHGWPGGYCARLGCMDTMTDCVGQTACVEQGSDTLCAARCPTGNDNECRGGYTCELLAAMNDDTPFRYVCVPGM